MEGLNTTPVTLWQTTGPGDRDPRERQHPRTPAAGPGKRLPAPSASLAGEALPGEPAEAAADFAKETESHQLDERA